MTSLKLTVASVSWILIEVFLQLSSATPNLPRRFTVHVESINTFDRQAKLKKEYYDFNSSLYRVDYKNTSDYQEQIIQTKDLKTGKAHLYSTNKKFCVNQTFHCSSKLQMLSPDARSWGLQTPCGILSLYEDNSVNKAYAGNQTVRNAPCDVWTSTMTNWPDSRPGELRFKWFFLRSSWSYDSQQQVPLRLEIDGQVQWNATLNATIALRLNFFSFETNFNNGDVFSVPDFCSGKKDNNDDNNDDHDDSGGESVKMYNRKHVFKVALLVGIMCIAVSMTFCGFYNHCKRRRSRRSRFY